MAHGKVHGKGGAAELLGMNPSTLRYRMDQLGIPYGRKVAR
jgi:transcriptional regulator with GAF, ATPase, and Fis domain